MPSSASRYGRQVGMLCESIGELDGKWVLCSDHQIGCAKPGGDQTSETVADRGSHKQRPGQHRHGSGNATDNGNVCLPVVGQARANKVGTCHVASNVLSFSS